MTKRDKLTLIAAGFVGLSAALMVFAFELLLISTCG